MQTTDVQRDALTSEGSSALQDPRGYLSPTQGREKVGWISTHAGPFSASWGENRAGTQSSGQKTKQPAAMKEELLAQLPRPGCLPASRAGRCGGSGPGRAVGRGRCVAAETPGGQRGGPSRQRRGGQGMRAASATGACRSDG